jgi:hypothetical protein
MTIFLISSKVLMGEYMAPYPKKENLSWIWTTTECLSLMMSVVSLALECRILELSQPLKTASLATSLSRWGN